MRFFIYFAILCLSTTLSCHTRNYQAFIERGGQSYLAQAQIGPDVQLWDFLSEPYRLTVDSSMVILYDKRDNSQSAFTWSEIQDDFNWLKLFPCLQKSLDSLKEFSVATEQRFDFPEGSWLIQPHPGQGFVGRWVPQSDFQNELVVILQEEKITSLA